MNTFMPRKSKYRKQQVGVIKGLATAGNSIAVGEYGLKVIQSGDITTRQLESARVAARKAEKGKKGGKLLIPIICDVPRSRRPLETRMGKGKSPVDHYAAPLQAGTVVMTFLGMPREVAFKAFVNASHKLPLKTAFIERIVA